MRNRLNSPGAFCQWHVILTVSFGALIHAHVKGCSSYYVHQVNAVVGFQTIELVTNCRSVCEAECTHEMKQYYTYASLQLLQMLT